jgi:hypothetical protein
MGRYSSPQDKLLNKLLDKPLDKLGELCPQDKLWRVEKVSSAANLKGGEGKFWDENLNTLQSTQGNLEDLGNMLGEKDDEDKQQIDGLGKIKLIMQRGNLWR